MIHTVKNKGQLETVVNNYFTSVKDDIILLHNSQWNGEDLQGDSYLQWKIMQYYNLVYLLSLLYIDINRNENIDKNYYLEKYKIEIHKKCLACEGIDFNKALEIFNINLLANEDGIELLELEDNFIVGNNPLPTSNYPILFLKENTNICYNYIENSEI